jgi:hypothetical protein
VRGGQLGTLPDAGVNQIDIFLSDRKLAPQHLSEVRAAPMRFHHAAVGMPGAPFQYVDDFMHQHVCQQVRDKSRLVGLDTIAENADVRAFVWQRVCQRAGLQGSGSLAGQRNVDSVRRAGFRIHPNERDANSPQHPGGDGFRQVGRPEVAAALVVHVGRHPEIRRRPRFARLGRHRRRHRRRRHPSSFHLLRLHPLSGKARRKLQT